MGGEENLGLALQMLQDAMKQNQDMLRHLMHENKSLREELNNLKTSSVTSSKLGREVMRKVARKGKSIIKKRMLDNIMTRPCELAELKEMIVDDSGYCSKATFYRYVDELMKEGHIQSVNNSLVVLEKQDAHQ